MALAVCKVRKGDLDTPAAIHRLVIRFYGEVLHHPDLKPFFDPAKLTCHLSIIETYWERMLLGGTRYHRNMVKMHREIHRQRKFRSVDFDHWLELFIEAVDQGFAGPKAERAKFLARAITANLRRILLSRPSQTA